MQKIFNIFVIFVLAMSLYGHNLQRQQIVDLKNADKETEQSIIHIIDAINDGAVYIDYEVTK